MLNKLNKNNYLIFDEILIFDARFDLEIFVAGAV